MRRGLVYSLEMGSSILKKGLMRGELGFQGNAWLDISLLPLIFGLRGEEGTYLDAVTWLVKGLMYS